MNAWGVEEVIGCMLWWLIPTLFYLIAKCAYDYAKAWPEREAAAEGRRRRQRQSIPTRPIQSVPTVEESVAQATTAFEKRRTIIAALPLPEEEKESLLFEAEEALRNEIEELLR